MSCRSETRYAVIYVSSYKGYFPEELHIYGGRSYTFMVEGASFQKPGKEMESALAVHIFSGAIDPLVCLLKEWFGRHYLAAFDET
jgi:hypothetical protein